MRKTGFTLIELLSVITVLGLLMLIVIPKLVNVIKESKSKTEEDTIEMYGRSVEQAIGTYFVKHPDKKEVSFKVLEEENLIEYKGPKVECETVEIYGSDLYLANCKVKDKYLEAKYGKHNPLYASLKENYIGYYADVDGDGNVDGVIYADLAHPSRTGASWKSNSYSYEAEDDLKEYTVSETNSPITTFGTNKIITLKPGSTGNSRFYVMALNDFREGAYQDKYYYWYKNAYEKMPSTVKDTSTDFGTGYDNTGKMIRIWNNNGNEEGWTTGATQYEYDIWGKIQEKYQEGWYIPSKGEWAAFADYLANRLENPLTTSNYKTIYGLSSWYWSSSQYYAFSAWYIHFYYGNVSSCTVGSTTYVRLGVTF